MTKEEAQELYMVFAGDYFQHRKVVNDRWFINKIYDDFESKICENCKFKTNESKHSYCRILDRTPIEYKDGFGCNRWESNNDN